MVKTYRRLAFNFSIFIFTIFVTLVTIIGLCWDIRIIFWFLPLTLLSCIFLFIYFNRLLKKYIYDRILPIYKTILQRDFTENEMQNTFNTKTDIIYQTNQLVSDWNKTRVKEITDLKEQEKYRREFLGDVSHELKTPIFNIQGYVLTLLDGGLEDAKINKKYLERTEKSINRLISIIEDLEAISRLESGELKLEFEKFNIVHLIEDLFEYHEISANVKKIKLNFIKNYDKPYWVFADKKRITQVLTNLIANSINYGKENGRTMVGFYDMDSDILIEVTDNGIGIEEKHLIRIFDRFYRVDKSRSREQGGTGLGLSIVKHILEAHKQKISVKSTFGAGTTITFTLKKA